jgi:hypothetical protein
MPRSYRSRSGKPGRLQREILIAANLERQQAALAEA